MLIENCEFKIVDGHTHEAIGALIKITCSQGVFYTHHEWLLHMDEEIIDSETLQTLKGKSFIVNIVKDRIYGDYADTFKEFNREFFEQMAAMNSAAQNIAEIAKLNNLEVENIIPMLTALAKRKLQRRSKP